MKNVIIPFVFLLFSVVTYSQQVPNSEFNTWISYGSYEEPENWNTSNEALSILQEETVFKSNDAYSGNYSALLQTRYLFGFTNVPGLLTLADISIDIISQTYTISGGLPLKQNVSKLTGMYKYSGAENDSATVLIYNFKRDEEDNIDTIGYGTTYLHDASNWSPFTVTMVNQNNHIPDTFNVIILSSGPEFHDGSILKIDSLAIETNTGIIYLDDEKPVVNVYPVPSSDFITFETQSASKNRNIHIFNISGKLVDIIDFNNTSHTYSISSLSDGKYVYNIIENGGTRISGSFIKQ